MWSFVQLYHPNEFFWVSFVTPTYQTGPFIHGLYILSILPIIIILWPKVLGSGPDKNSQFPNFVAPTCRNDPINTRSCRGAKLVRGRTFKAPIVTVAGKIMILSLHFLGISTDFVANFLHFLVDSFNGFTSWYIFSWWQYCSPAIVSLSSLLTTAMCFHNIWVSTTTIHRFRQRKIWMFLGTIFCFMDEYFAIFVMSKLPYCARRYCLAMR